MAQGRIEHASCVAYRGWAALIRGSSGSGKSALSLQMIALGAVLVADDRTELLMQGGGVTARAPAAISGKIEARYVGLLNVPAVAEAGLALVVDLDRQETERLPPLRNTRIFDVDLPLFYKVSEPYFAASLLQVLAHGRFA
ncbi:Hpr(Ser) kinase/phosphatase [Rhodovulum imhoffii]|uniref:Hpr(Ser) kinase/phosphatase n=1 Tax=Rhodovulum imhoffii TaxID=365340 RepID=A0A2T5BUT7_9RHOB|nr:HPr kinase/phosphatase C-terminal domain-containing protein [Rhodovulum imhoffii]MBK5934846.1 hypothetical protein [Rhodovulum imhoffii]PTN03247.1 Hpr(Ser) kinase/phosphatase [Rhodovulum imhoffii]